MMENTVSVDVELFEGVGEAESLRLLLLLRTASGVCRNIFEFIFDRTKGPFLFLGCLVQKLLLTKLNLYTTIRLTV